MREHRYQNATGLRTEKNDNNCSKKTKNKTKQKCSTQYKVLKARLLCILHLLRLYPTPVVNI